MCTLDLHRRWVYRSALAWPLVVLVVLTSGCASSRCKDVCCPSPCTQSPNYTAGLAEVERRHITADLSAIDQFEALALPPAENTQGSEPYRSLGPADCQCYAVQASAGGNRIAAERSAACAQNSKKPRRTERITRLRMQLLATAEIAARDMTAAQALEAYYKLAAAEHGRDSLAKSLRELAEAEKQLGKLTGRGLQGVSNDGSLERQRYELSSQLGQLELDRHELTETLRNKLGVPIHEPWWSVWPDTPLAVDAVPIDEDTEISIALESRAELRLLRIVYHNIDAETLSAARMVLSQVNGLLGLEPPSVCSCCCLCLLNGPLCSDCSEEMEVAARRAQVAQQLAEQEAEVISEVRMAIRTIETRLEQVILARQDLASWTSRLAAVEARASTAESTFLEISQARIQKLQAEDNLIRQVVAWHLGHVQLKKAKGVLSQECGYDPCSH